MHQRIRFHRAVKIGVAAQINIGSIPRDTVCLIQRTDQSRTGAKRLSGEIIDELRQTVNVRLHRIDLQLHPTYLILNLHQRCIDVDQIASHGIELAIHCCVDRIEFRVNNVEAGIDLNLDFIQLIAQLVDAIHNDFFIRCAKLTEGGGEVQGSCGQQETVTDGFQR